MKKGQGRKILSIALAIALAAAAGAGAFLLIRHERAQAQRIGGLTAENAELRERIRKLEEDRGGTEAFEAREAEAAALEARITRLENAQAYGAAEIRWLAVGNSITLHAPNEVWPGTAGMAASSAEKDYVHLVAAELSKRGRTAAVPFYFYAWETAEDRGAALPALDPYLDPRLDIVSVQLGENAEDLTDFGRDFEDLIRYIRDRAPAARILVIGDYWRNAERERMKREAAEKTGAAYVSLEEIQGKKEYEAGIGAAARDDAGGVHRIENELVAAHPGDAGMRAIAGAVLAALETENTAGSGEQ